MDSEALDILNYESGLRSNWDEQIKQSELSAVVQREEMNLFVMLNLKLQKDGNQWCVLLGADIQSGICGFGDTPIEAIWDFNKAFAQERIPKRIQKKDQSSDSEIPLFDGTREALSKLST